jgi:acyl-CoA synthetase (AMP-forming)/AMP-acid ligase II
MTETAAMVAAVPNEDFLNDPKAGAVPLGEARFSIEDGQIRVQSPALFQGYQGRASVDLSQGYLTGDAGALDASGRLHVFGRLDRLINTGGEKVDPAEVEAALLQIDGIEAAKVFGEPDPEWGQVVVARVRGALDLDLDQVRVQLKATLANYKVPKLFR